MKLSRRQAAALISSTSPINIWYGSVRSSKTHASLWAFIRYMQRRAVAEEAAGIVLIVGMSTNTVWRNIFQPLLTSPAFKHVAPFIKYRRNAPSGTMFGQEFSVVGGGTEASWLSIQGMTVAFCLGDEATGWAETFWDMLISRLSLAESQILVTCNPGTSSHYLKKLIDSGDPDVHVEKFLLEENPTLSRKYVDRLRRMYSGLFYRRMILGEWVAAEGAVFEDWDPDRMTVRPGDIPELSRVIAFGVDYGTTNETVGEVLALGVDGKLYVTDEWRPRKGRRLTDKMLVDDMKLWRERRVDAGLELPRYSYIDPAAASFKEEMRVQRITPHDADNDVINGISVVASQLSAGTLKISTNCKLLLEELPNYRWDSKAADRGVDKPVKENDHAVDALRYSVFSSRHIWRRLVKQPSLMA